MPTPDDPVAQLRDAGLRVTRPRLAVIEALGPVSTQAIYDVLKAFTAAGLVRRIEPAGSPARFELRVGDNHHHVVCRSCGAIDDVDCAVGSAPCLHIPDSHGFVVDEAEVTFWGLCPDCSASTSTTTTVR